MAKGLTTGWQGLERMSGLCREADLPFTMNMTFGEPGDSESSVEQKLDFLKRVDAAFSVLRVGTRVLPNTGAAQTALREGLIESESELMRPTFYTDAGVRDWIADRLREEAAEYPRWNLM